jgi:hypothetical protein
MRLSALEAGLQAMFHFGPFVVENAEVDGIANTAGRSNKVPTKRTFFFCPDAENGVSRLLIQSIGFQFDTNAVADFEGVLEHQEFRFGVAGGTLPGGGDPSRSDFDLAVWGINVHEPRAADHGPRGALDGREDDGLSSMLLSESAVHVAMEIVRGLHGIRNPAKDVGEIVLGGLPEEGLVLGAKRFKSDDGAFESDRNERRGGLNHGSL